MKRLAAVAAVVLLAACAPRDDATVADTPATAPAMAPAPADTVAHDTLHQMDAPADTAPYTPAQP